MEDNVYDVYQLKLIKLSAWAQAQKAAQDWAYKTRNPKTKEERKLAKDSIARYMRVLENPFRRES